MPQFGFNLIAIVFSFIPYNRNGLALLMSGCEAVERHRRNEQYRATPLFITARDFAERKHYDLVNQKPKIGFINYLKKAGLASRNIVRLQKIILLCVDFCFYFLRFIKPYYSFTGCVVFALRWKRCYIESP